MDKQRKKTVFFCKRIEELQRFRGYSTNYVMENLFFDDGELVIKDRQVLDKYKSGDRAPQYFEDTVRAFAKFYDATTDYLLGMDDTPNPQIKSVQDFTGLSEGAIKRLTQFKNEYPDILAMVDAIIAGTTAEDVADYITLYNQIYSDYRDTKLSGAAHEDKDSKQPDTEVKGLLSEMDKVQRRFFLTQALYNYWQRIVTAKLAPSFDKEMLMEADRQQYEHLQAFSDTIPDIDPPEQTITNVTFTPAEDGSSDK